MAGASFRARAVAARFEADAVDGRSRPRLAEDLVDLVPQRGFLGDRSTVSQPKLRACGQALRIHIADDDDRRAQQLRRGGAGETDRPGARHVNRRAGGDPGR